MGAECSTHHRGKESGGTIAAPVLSHALQILRTIGSLVVELALNELILFVAFDVLLFEPAVGAPCTGSILEGTSNLQRVLVDRVKVSVGGVDDVELQNLWPIVRVLDLGRPRCVGVADGRVKGFEYVGHRILFF